MADTSVRDIVTSFILKAQTYANDSISKAFDNIDNILESSNNMNWINLQPNPGITIKWENDVAKPFGIGDIPNMNNNNFQYIKLYQDDWMEKYRLIMNENFKDLFSFRYSENKLQDILQNGFVIQKSVQDQIINRAVDTELSLFNSRKDKVLNEWSSNGWNIPNSFTISRIDNLEKEVNDKISNINRDYVIKNQDIYTEMLRFAIQISTELLPKCVDIASGFAGKYSQVYNYGAENVKNYLQGLSVVNQSIKDYHSTMISRVQTAQNEAQNWRDYDLRAKSAQANFELQKADFNVKTTVQGVQLLTTIGTAALSANQSIVSLTQAGIQTNNSPTTV